MPVADRRIRILQSENTPGYVTWMDGDDGITRLCHWTTVPDLLLFNPFQYFITHPEIESIWIQTLDTDAYTASSARSNPAAIVTASARSQRSNQSNGSAGSGGENPGYALVIRRSECTLPQLWLHRELQHLYFIDAGIVIPDADMFSSNLHGR